jgi:hypothetical protein
MEELHVQTAAMEVVQQNMFIWLELQKKMVPFLANLVNFWVLISIQNNNFVSRF